MNIDTFSENSVIKQNETAIDRISEMLRAGIKAAQAGNRSEARHLLLSVTEADSTNENAWLWLASISEYPEELLVFLKNVLKINPGNERAIEWSQATKSLLAKTFVQRGIDAHKQQQTDFAKQFFLQAILNDDENELAWLWLASTTEAVEEKISHLHKVLRINPENETAHASLQAAKSQKANNLMRKANAAAVSGHHEDANHILDEILRNSPELEDAWILKSYLTNSFDEKLECFEKVLEVNPANETAQASINSLRLMKSAVEPKESEEDSIYFEESEKEQLELNEVEEPKQTEEITEVAEVYETEPAETENIGFEQPEQLFDAEEKQFEEQIPQPNSAFEEVGEESAEDQYLLEVEGDSAFAEEEPTENSYENEPLEIELPDTISENAENYEEAVDLKKTEFEDSETENNDFYSQNNFEQEVTEVVDFGEEKVEETVEEMQFDFNEVVEPFEETATAESDYKQFNYIVEDVEESQPEEIFAETNDVQNEFQPESFAKENSSEDFTEKETFEAVNGDTDEIVTNESFTENFQANEDSDENGAVQSLENEQSACPFCHTENDVLAFTCGGCNAVLTLSDLEMLLAHKDADAEMLRRAVEQMEIEEVNGRCDSDELMILGIGCINLKNLRGGLNYLRKAAKLDPNDVLLNSQVHSLAIRLAEIEQQESIHRSMPQDRTIMVVDDSATVRKLISSKLEKSGHTVVCAVDGVEALEKLKEFTPDLVLLDITMPRMDGYQVCKLIRNDPFMKDIPVVMISGKDGFFDKVRGRMAGTTGYITKPFGPETLMKTVEAFVAQKPDIIEEEEMELEEVI